jgi:hypothetical protein
MNREMATQVDPVLAVPPAVYAATQAALAIVDTRGADAATVLLNVGAIVASGNMTPKLVHGNDSGLSDSADVAAEDLVGAFPSVLLAASAVKVGYRGGKRYLRVVLTLNSGTSVAVGGVILLGKLDITPAE